MRRDSDGYYYILDRKKELIKYKVLKFYIISSQPLTVIQGVSRFVSAGGLWEQDLNASIVAPAELEAVLLENPQIADVGVIGVVNDYDKNELPRRASSSSSRALLHAEFRDRAYVVPTDSNILKSPGEKLMFEKNIEVWIKGQVAYYKYLRGGACHELNDGRCRVAYSTSIRRCGCF